MPLQTIRTLRAAGASGAYFRRSVLRRFAVYLLIMLPLVIGYALAERNQLTQIAERESRRDLENLSRVFAEEVRATVNTIDMSLLQLRAHWQREHIADFPAIVEQLNRDLHGKVLLQVAVTDTRGIVRFSNAANAASAAGVDVSDREHIRVHLQGRGQDRLFVSAPVLGRVSGRWTVQFTRPVFRHDGTLAGVIVASVEPAYFARFYDSIDLGQGASLALLRHDGTIIVRSAGGRNDRDLGRRLTGVPYDGPRAPFGYFRRTGQVDHIERHYVWRDLPESGLMVTVGQSVADADARYARQKTGESWGAALVALLLAGLGWVAIAASDNRQRAVEALAVAEARWKLALNAAGEGVWDWDMRAGQVTLSSRAQALLGLHASAAPASLDSLTRALHPEDQAGFNEALEEHLKGHSADFVAEARMGSADGGWHWLLVRGMLVERDRAGRPARMVGTFADIDARKNEEEQMRYLAHHDGLTGLPNRLLFTDRLNQAIRMAQRAGDKLAVLYFDLDKFKPVNDTYGHEVGDRLLQQVAVRVSDGLRDSDTLCRVGGDEFVALLPHCGTETDVRRVAENVLALLNQEFRVQGHSLRISGSIGYALYPDCGGRTDAEVVRCADQAMYYAKEHGRGQVSGQVRSAPAPQGAA